MPTTDLRDPAVRAAVTARLADRVAGRPVIVGPVVLAGSTGTVDWLRELGCPVLVVATARGAGPVPEAGTCTVVEVSAPATTSLTDELRTLDTLVRRLPADAVEAIEAFDPERRGVWWTSPFVTSDEAILGRPVTGGRPASFLALEDKMVADHVWSAAGVRAAPHALVPLEARSLADATAALAGPLGAVWTGDARGGFNGGGDYVRWVRDDRDQEEARAFFLPRCDRVRVMPFLDGVPCSIHGIVFPDGTAVFRPVEIVVLRDLARGRFVYGGLGTTWDPPEPDRREMREVARRVGAHLQAAHGYRGAFGIDGVLTADGFLPTELNTRMSAGLTTLAEVDRRFFSLLQCALVDGVDTGVTAAVLESLVPLMDATRAGKVVAFGAGTRLGDHGYPLRWDGDRFHRASTTTGNRLVAGDTPSGFFAKVDPCVALEPGARLAHVDLALMDLLDREHGTGFGALEAAPDVRR